VSKEKRLHRRKLMNARVLLLHPEIGEYQTYTHDISDGGVFVLLQNTPDLPPGTELDMHLLDSGQPEFLFKMQVARIETFGLGLKFLGYEKNGKFHTIEDLRKDWNKQGSAGKS